jgi:hypothetical protein
MINFIFSNTFALLVQLQIQAQRKFVLLLLRTRDYGNLRKCSEAHFCCSI